MYFAILKTQKICLAETIFEFILHALILIVKFVFLDPLADKKGILFTRTKVLWLYAHWWGSLGSTKSFPTFNQQILWRYRPMDKILIHLRQSTHVN